MPNTFVYQMAVQRPILGIPYIQGLKEKLMADRPLRMTVHYGPAATSFNGVGGTLRETHSQTEHTYSFCPFAALMVMASPSLSFGGSWPWWSKERVLYVYTTSTWTSRIEWMYGGYGKSGSGSVPYRIESLLPSSITFSSIWWWWWYTSSERPHPAPAKKKRYLFLSLSLSLPIRELHIRLHIYQNPIKPRCGGRAAATAAGRAE